MWVFEIVLQTQQASQERHVLNKTECVLFSVELNSSWRTIYKVSTSHVSIPNIRQQHLNLFCMRSCIWILTYPFAWSCLHLIRDLLCARHRGKAQCVYVIKSGKDAIGSTYFSCRDRGRFSMLCFRFQGLLNHRGYVFLPSLSNPFCVASGYATYSCCHCLCFKRSAGKIETLIAVHKGKFSGTARGRSLHRKIMTQSVQTRLAVDDEGYSMTVLFMSLGHRCWRWRGWDEMIDWCENGNLKSGEWIMTPHPTPPGV